jgi:hypothetical protein
VKWATDTAKRDVAEVTPVSLSLFPRQSLNRAAVGLLNRGQPLIVASSFSSHDIEV